jgi:hypothetical protein
MSEGKQERRRNPRLKAEHELELRGASGESIGARSIDISLGGVYCTLDAHLPMFSRLEITLNLPVVDDEGVTHLLECGMEAVIVRIEPEDPDPEVHDYHSAMAFVNLEEDVELILAKYLLQSLVRG